MHRYRLFFVGLAAAWCAAAAAVTPMPAMAQSPEFDRAVRECMENGFSRDECVRHAERVLNLESSSQRRDQEERFRRLEEKNKPRRPSPRHPGRRGFDRP